MTGVHGEDLTDTSALDTLDDSDLTAAVAAVHAAQGAVDKAAHDVITRAVLAVYPDAQAYVLDGDWNEDGEVRCTLDEVWTASAGRCSEDDGNTAVTLIGEAPTVETALMWLDGDDYEGRNVFRLVGDDVVIEGLDDPAADDVHPDLRAR